MSFLFFFAGDGVEEILSMLVLTLSSQVRMMLTAASVVKVRETPLFLEQDSD